MLYVYILIFICSLVLIIYGGDIFVDSSIKLAQKTKISPIIIGATIVSVATTLPELIVSVLAASQGSYSLAVGNSAGSVICNTALICGLSITIRPSALKTRTSTLKYLLLIFASLLLLFFGFSSNQNFKITLWESLILLTLFVIFMSINVYDSLKEVRHEKNISSTSHLKSYARKINQFTIIQDFNLSEPVSKKTSTSEKKHSMTILIILFILGAAMIAVGASALVKSAKFIATSIGISETLVGLTIVSIGTSLPELITTITSLKKKSSELGYGNIIGANIINLTLILGLSGIASGSNGLEISTWTFYVSLPLICVLSVLFVAPLMFKNKSFRWQGITILSIYVLYLAFLITMSLLGYQV